MLFLRLIFDLFNFFSNFFYFILIGITLAWINYFLIAKRFKNIPKTLISEDFKKINFKKKFKKFKKIFLKNQELFYKVLTSIILLLSIVILSIFLNKNNELKEEIFLLNNTINELKEFNSILQSNYSNLLIDYSNLEYEYTQLKWDLKRVNSSYENLNKNIDEKFEEIDEYFNKIRELSEWITDNAIFDNRTWEPQRPAGYIMDTTNVFTSFKEVKETLISKCLYEFFNFNKIKTGCLFLINDKNLKLSYKEDNLTSGDLDNMQSLSEFLINKGGDCEDYSLFFKAQINYLLNYSIDKNFKIEAHYFGKRIQDPHDFTQRTVNEYFLSKDNYWFYPNVNVIEFNDFIYPNIVCGNIYDLNKDEIAGHCMIALTNEKINSSNDIHLLNHAPLIEPQTGIYEGVINHFSSEVYLIDNNFLSESFINWIITNDDFYIYFKEKNKWESNNEFYNSLIEIKESFN